MLGKIFGMICAVSLVFGIATSRAAELGNAVLDGASGAVTLTISLCGMMCLWCGVMRVLERAGVIGKLSRVMKPLLALFFPDAVKSGEGCGEIAANISANLLGIGNAATPLALSAMDKLQKNNPDPGTASGDMITLAVLNTASISLVPTTILTLRRAAGSSNPFSVVVPIWICSFATSTLALLLCRGMRICKTGKKGRSAKIRGDGQERSTVCGSKIRGNGQECCTARGADIAPHSGGYNSGKNAKRVAMRPGLTGKGDG